MEGRGVGGGGRGGGAGRERGGGRWMDGGREGGLVKICLLFFVQLISKCNINIVFTLAHSRQ